MRPVLLDQGLRARRRGPRAPSPAAPRSAAAARRGPPRRGARCRSAARARRPARAAGPRSAPISSSRSGRARSACLAGLRGPGQRVLELRRAPPGRPAATAWATAASRARRSRRASARGPARALLRGRRGRARRRARRAPGPAPPRCARRAGPPSRPAAAGPGTLLQLVAHAVSGRRARRPSGASLGRGEPLLELGQGRRGRRRAAPRAAAIERSQPLGLAAGGPGLRPELPELLGHGGHPGVGLVQPVQGGLRRPASATRLLLQGRLQREAGPVEAVTGLDEARGRLVDRGLHLEQARRGGRAAGGPVARRARRPRG